MITNDIIAGMIGIMLFFTVAVAPTVFKVLPAEWASQYVRNFFPKYYFCLGILSAIAALTSNNAQTALTLWICSAFFAFLLLFLTNQINLAKDREQHRRFHVLHSLSVIINLAQLAVFIYLLT